MSHGAETALVAATVQPVAELFTGTATALWATTYNLDLGLFNEFLLGRLGEPPLNIAVLADHRRLTASLERIPAERADTLAAVNRRWLLRGVRFGGAFHAKSYLAVAGSRVTLLVGSGNLSTGGLDEGREVFTTFRSGTPLGDTAIAAWRSWMRRLVGIVGDTTLAERFNDLEGRIPPPPAVALALPSPLLHNLDAPIADQFAAAVIAQSGSPVDELWLAAPFYDADAAAVGALLDAFTPTRVQLFVTGSTSVNGERLHERLSASGAQVRVAAYQPDRFTHAKLVGVITGGRGWLLSGSANLSRAALTLTPSAHGNIELAVLASLDAAELRAVFMPPDTTLADGSLVSLTFHSDSEPPMPAVRLVTATALTDGRVEIVTESPDIDGWLLDDLTTRQPLSASDRGRAVTDGPLAGRLVQLVDCDHQVLSNRVVVDDPVALAAALTAGAGRPGGDRPAEFAPADLDSPLAQALIWLHRNLVMDVSERATATSTGGVGAGNESEQGDDDLWDRLEREQLAHDPRMNTYARLWRSDAHGGVEPIIELLEALAARAPAKPTVHSSRSLLARLLDPTTDDAGDGQEDSERPPARRWKASTRVRVRARNVLRRWAAAQSDPRLVWVDPLAPAGNFAMIAGTLAHLRLDNARNPQRVELTDDDLDDLWQRWLRSFAGTGEGDGWLHQLDDATRALALDRLPDWLPEAVAALCWLAVRPGSGYRGRAVAFQPVLTAALDQGLLDPTDTTARYLSVVTGQTVTRGHVDDQLLAAVAFIDDVLWCLRIADALGLDELKLQAPPGAAGLQVRIDVRGITEPLLDARVPRLVVAARHYRRCDGVALFAADASWRLAFVNDETIAYLPDLGAVSVESAAPLTGDVLDALAAEGGVLADLISAGQGAVA